LQFKHFLAELEKLLQDEHLEQNQQINLLALYLVDVSL